MSGVQGLLLLIQQNRELLELVMQKKKDCHMGEAVIPAFQVHLLKNDQNYTKIIKVFVS